jgi:hypothetical protein
MRRLRLEQSLRRQGHIQHEAITGACAHNQVEAFDHKDSHATALKLLLDGLQSNIRDILTTRGQPDMKRVTGAETAVGDTKTSHSTALQL